MSMPFNEDAEVKQLFVDESLEGLQRCEQLLIDAEAGKAKADLVDTMFRDFHTIKGTAALLGYEKTAQLAHAAEDLMSSLRDRTVPAEPKHFSRLVAVVDVLRALIEHTRDHVTEGPTEVETLVQTLREPVENVEGEAGSEPQQVSDETQHTPIEQADNTVRVNVGVLDTLMNLMGELVLARNQMVQVVRGMADANAQSVAQRLALVTSDLQEQIMKTRMQPIARVFDKIPRLVRDLSTQLNKRAAVELDGQSTEIDKALIEAIRDPLLHIIRNAMDHGLETPNDRLAAGKPASGTLKIRAAHQGGMVVIEISDDGRGIDGARIKERAVARGFITQVEADRLNAREAIELVFRPGFSTAENITSVSGRGVGMDVVRTQVERAGGHVELDSRRGQGTTIRLKMPLTLAIIPALLIKDGGQRFAIPQANLLELIYFEEGEFQKRVETVRGVPIFRLRGEILPLVELTPLLRGQPQETSAGVNVVIISLGQRRYGLVVETINDTEEIVIKPLHNAIKRLNCYAGATVLGDGGVALILDVAGIATRAGIDLNTHQVTAPSASAGVAESHSMLVFVAGNGAQCAVPISTVARIEQVDASLIETIAGASVLQYRGEIMPIIRPESILPIGEALPGDDGIQRLLVFNFGRPVGVAVSAIVDVHEVTHIEHGGDVPHVLGQTVTFGKTTMLIDVFGLVRQLAPSTIRNDHQAVLRKPRVLLADAFDSLRSSLAGYLRAAGLDVVERSSDMVSKDLRAATEAHGFDAVIAGFEQGTAKGLELIRAFKSERPELPVVAMQRGDEVIDIEAKAAGANACVRRIEREQVLEALLAAGIHAQHGRAP